MGRRVDAKLDELAHDVPHLNAVEELEEAEGLDEEEAVAHRDLARDLGLPELQRSLNAIEKQLKAIEDESSEQQSLQSLLIRGIQVRLNLLIFFLCLLLLVAIAIRM